MTVRQKFYVLIGLVIPWFIFGTLVLNRSNVDFNDLKVFEGQIESIGTTITRDPIKGNTKDILCFTFKGLSTKLGIYHNTKSDYDFYLKRVLPGNIVKVYFDEFGMETMENINLHVFQMEAYGEILLNKEKLNRTDRKVGLILYGVGFLFSFVPIWFYRTKIIRTR